MEKRFFRGQLGERVRDFGRKHRSLSFDKRVEALMDLIGKVEHKEESFAFLQVLVRSGGWLLELEECLKKARWLRGLLERRQ